MEDRITPELYLEMTDADPDRFASSRVSAVLEEGLVTRATWWENVKPGRTDLPRELPEFGLLVVYEVEPGFRPSASPAGVAGHHFRRYPRPGQGRLTGRPTIGLSLVLVSPKTPEDAPALRDWADFVHIRHIAEAAVPGFAMITPYENVSAGDPRFLHFYEMDSDDPEAAFQLMPKLVIDRVGTPGTPEFEDWAFHPALRIMYVNSFRRLGERA